MFFQELETASFRWADHTSDAFDSGIIRWLPSACRAGSSVFRRNSWTFNQIAPHHYKNPVVMLVGTGTFSAAEDMAAAFDMLDRGKIIGQPTGGSTGQPLSFSLPGGGSARVCTKHDSYADGTEFVGVGIQPDILVEPQVQDVIDGFDRTLDVARKELQKQR